MEKEFEVLEKKYKLPSFKELNEDFEIGKIENYGQTLLRSVRKVMMEKIVNSLSFLEMLMNPVNMPRAYFAYIKSMTSEDKKKVEKIYSELSYLSLLALEREIEYSEKGEAEMINKIFKKWNEIKPLFISLMKNIQKPNGSLVKKEKSYFG